MAVEAPLDPPDEGTPHNSTFDCPTCETETNCTEWVDVVGQYKAQITTVCDICGYTIAQYDDTYGYDG